MPYFYCECNLNLNLTLETIIFHVLEFGFIFCYFLCILSLKGTAVSRLIPAEFRYGARALLAPKILFEMCVRTITKGSGTQEMSQLRKRSFQRGSELLTVRIVVVLRGFYPQ